MAVGIGEGGGVLIVDYILNMSRNPKPLLISKYGDPSLHPQSQQLPSFPASQSVQQGPGAFRSFTLFFCRAVDEAALRTRQWSRHLQHLEPTGYFGWRCQLCTQQETNSWPETVSNGHSEHNMRKINLFHTAGKWRYSLEVREPRCCVSTFRDKLL